MSICWYNCQVKWNDVACKGKKYKKIEERSDFVWIKYVMVSVHYHYSIEWAN